MNTFCLIAAYQSSWRVLKHHYKLLFYTFAGLLLSEWLVGILAGQLLIKMRCSYILFFTTYGSEYLQSFLLSLAIALCLWMVVFYIRIILYAHALHLYDNAYTHLRSSKGDQKPSLTAVSAVLLIASLGHCIIFFITHFQPLSFINSFSIELFDVIAVRTIVSHVVYSLLNSLLTLFYLALADNRYNIMRASKVLLGLCSNRWGTLLLFSLVTYFFPFFNLLVYPYAYRHWVFDNHLQ